MRRPRTEERLGEEMTQTGIDSSRPVTEEGCFAIRVTWRRLGPFSRARGEGEFRIKQDAERSRRPLPERQGPLAPVAEPSVAP
jgi:hypothetical protein